MGKLNSTRRRRTKAQRQDNAIALREYARQLGEALGAWPLDPERLDPEMYTAALRLTQQFEKEWVNAQTWINRCFIYGREVCWQAMPGQPPDWLFDKVLERLEVDKLNPDAVFIAAYGLSRMVV